LLWRNQRFEIIIIHYNVKGGNWWDKTHTQKATASNGGPIILAARLFKETGDHTYLTYANKVFDFWWHNMVERSGHVCDHISTVGTKQCSWKFTYNEGLMIGAATELFEVTKNLTYLAKAQDIMKFMLSNEVVSTSYGNILSDGKSCSSDCDEFKGIGFRYLAQFQLASKSTMVVDFLKSNVESIWNNDRRAADSSFGVLWEGPAPLNGATIAQGQQNSVAMALNIYATISTMNATSVT